MAKGKVILIHPNGTEHEFGADHAQRIMSLPNPGGWAYKEEPKKKKGKDANTSRSITGKATSAEAPEEDCGCN